MDAGTTLAPATRHAALLALLAALAATLTAIAVAIPLADAPADDRVLSAFVHGLIVAVPAVVALAVLAHRPQDRFARRLLAVGLVWSVPALAESADPALYSVGRVATWVAEALLVYLLLSFPAGRLTSVIDRRLVWATAAVAGLLYVPSALVVQQYPEPSAWASCGTACPENALALTGSEPALVEAIVRPLRETLTVLLYFAVAAVLLRRRREAGPMLQRALLPVVATAAFRAAALTAYLVGRAIDPGATSLDALGWLYLLSLPIVAAGFGAGFIVRGLYAATALERLAVRLRALASPQELRPAMADALEDPTLRVLFWRRGEPGQWIDETGWPVPAPHAGDGKEVTEVEFEGRRVAAIEHDAALAQDPALMQAAASYALSVIENNRLVGELRDSLGELSRSRSRLVAVGDDIRRRVERDLHDGAQQRLIALRIQLGVQSERLAPTEPAVAAELATLGDDVERTIDEVRALARGIYPPLLSERGLPAALQAAARTSAVPASVDSDGIGRFTPEVESTVYFACVEAMQNAGKHARGATHIDISLRAADDLVFEVRDDGEGFNRRRAVNGGGLTNLRDRLAAVGGAVTVESAPGAGTLVAGRVPLEAA